MNLVYSDGVKENVSKFGTSNQVMEFCKFFEHEPLVFIFLAHGSSFDECNDSPGIVH